MVHKIIIRGVAALMLCMMCNACQQEDFSLPPVANQSDGNVLTFVCDPLEVHKVTRAADAKDDEEKRINQLYIFFFGSDGNYLKGGYLVGYDADNKGGFYAPGEGVTMLKIDNTKFDNPSLAESTTVYAVANLPASLFTDEDGNDEPDNFPDLTSLESYIYAPGNEFVTLGLPERGMPMVGKKVINLTSTDETEQSNRTIELKALMARVDVSIQLASDITDNKLPALTLVDWSARNLPTKVSFTEPANKTGEGWEDWGVKPTDPKDTGNPKDITTKLQRTIYNNNGQITFSFYMFENIQKPSEVWEKNAEGTNWINTSDNSVLYPSDLKEYQRQRYKPKLADEHAAAVELHGYYSTYNDNGEGSATYEVRYTLYLGANHTDNFEVKRNHQYKNDITIKGLTQVGTNPEHITFDARVNVKEEGNEFYIAILRERNHDAHFCVTPMDVYLFADESKTPTMEVILGEVPDGTEEPTDIPDWVRMERICAEDMASGTVTASGFTAYPDGTHLVTGKSFKAGNGKRAFFTANLVKETLAESGKRATVLSNRDRVYFYIDENLSDFDRDAIVTLIYKENGVEVRRRTLKLTQVHLLPIDIYQHNNGTGDFKGTIYMEQFEEYLDHYDPLDEYSTDQIYAGLPWAEKNTTLANTIVDRLYQTEWGSAVYDPYDTPSLILFDGLAYTSFILTELDSEQKSMTLNQKPKSALQYCHNKNKRDDNGLVPASYGKTIWGYYWEKSNSSKWFLPGIRQMEQALTHFYSTYSEFQNYYYWSISAAEEWGKTDGQQRDYARATRVDLGEEGGYAQSGGNRSGRTPYLFKGHEYGSSDGGGGYAPRTQELRIRAFRVDKEPYDYEITPP